MEAIFALFMLVFVVLFPVFICCAFIIVFSIISKIFGEVVTISLFVITVLLLLINLFGG